VRHVVLAALLLVTAINYVQRNCIGPAETTIRADLHLADTQTGDAMSVFFLTYALLQVPSGWLAQRWGARAALALFTAGWSVAVGLSALAGGLAGLLVARLALGAFQAGIFPCATLILAVWYPASRRGLASALLNSFMLIGTAIGSMITGLLLGPLGWRWLFALYAVPGLLWAAWFAFWFRNRPQDHPGVNPAELALIEAGRAEKRPPPQVDDPPDVQVRAGGPATVPWAAIFLSASLALLCLQQFGRAGANRFFDNWLPTYLQEGRGVSTRDAGLLASLPNWAGVVGGVVGGMISDAVLVRTGSRRAARKGVALASLLAGTLCYLLAYPIPDVYLAAVVLSAGAFFTTFSAPCSYALTMDMGGRHVAVVFGLMNMAGNFGSLAFTWITPRLKAWTGGNWDAGLAVFAGLHLAAALCWLVLNPDGVIGERPSAPSPDG
jgi:ACS family glucarate transporter-like MFS transporter